MLAKHGCFPMTCHVLECAHHFSHKNPVYKRQLLSPQRKPFLLSTRIQFSTSKAMLSCLTQTRKKTQNSALFNHKYINDKRPNEVVVSEKCYKAQSSIKKKKKKNQVIHLNNQLIHWGPNPLNDSTEIAAFLHESALKLSNSWFSTHIICV